ncbi:hypothetical protein OG417_44825 [Actinoallomurus sp. NBC_01490]|uniref:hypothetical protein n=1 Tax=Actinoallomurus sp. NBC_01490 TaxID=2903557 RepID=UPI002E2F11C3|nr:hypothetical protein [Actinoallomurus sp. NBC_01490]
MQAIVDAVLHAAPSCFRKCAHTARFTVWSDQTNLDGEASDMDPITACGPHLPDACVIKMTGAPETGETEPEEPLDQLGKLAKDIRAWDADRRRVTHKENHEGGAFSRWHDSDDWAVNILRSVQEILGDAAKARPVKICSPGSECDDCAAIES